MKHSFHISFSLGVPVAPWCHVSLFRALLVSLSCLQTEAKVEALAWALENEVRVPTVTFEDGGDESRGEKGSFSEAYRFVGIWARSSAAWRITDFACASRLSALFLVLVLSFSSFCSTEWTGVLPYRQQK